MTRELAAQILAEGGTTRMTTKPKPKPEPDAERRFREGREAVAAQEHGHFNRTKPDTEEGEREMDLSNARIIEWDFYGETQVGARQSRGERFQYAYRGRAHTVSEEEIRTLWEGPPVRVVAEFPRPSLAEVVGDAPAFWFTNSDNIPFIACRAGDWRGPGDDGLWYALPRHRGDRPYMFEGPLRTFRDVVLDSVIPLVAREVVS